MRKNSTALRMLLLVASIGFVGLCSATAFTFIRSWVTSSVNGTAYLDCNRDGIKDNSEIGFANMTVTLAGRTGVGDTVTLTTTTDASGLYHFEGLVSGTYSLQFGFPSGTTALSYSPQNTGSQVNASGRTAPLSIDGTNDVNGINAGVIDQTPPRIQFTHPGIAAYVSGDTVVVECDNLPIMDASWVTVTDNSGRIFAATFADLDEKTGVCSRDGYIKILHCAWSASDVCGNSNQVALYVKIIDNKAPTLANVPVNITVKTATGEVIPTPPSVTATDNCINTSLTVTYNETETFNACGKIITRTWACTDDCGNRVSNVQTITVISVTACLNSGNPPSDTFYIGLPGGSSLQTCLDLGGIGRSISNMQHCGTGTPLLTVSPINGTCIDVTVTSPLMQVSTDTFCALNCNALGECRNMVLIFNSVARFPPCDVISSRDLATINTANCSDLGCFCLADSVDINDLRNNYTITDNNVTYTGGYRGCNFDTIYSYTYFTVPDMGTRGPYRLDYWQINGTDRSLASFNTMQQLVDSMNVWDPIGNWQIDPVVFAIAGGSTRNTYGQMKITRLANRAYGFLELNLGIISNGIQMCVTSGFHSITFKNNNSGCSDTITVRLACADTTSGKPHAIDDVVTTTKNTPLTVNILANDTLFGTLSRPLSIIGSARRGTVSLSSNQIVFSPTLDFCGGIDTLSYEICNANGCDTANVFITINCDPTSGIRLTAVDDRITTLKNKTIRFRPLDNDTVVGGLLALGVVTASRHGSIGFSGTDSLIYTPNIGYCGLDTMEYRLCNNSFVCDTATIFITVTCDTTGGNLLPIAIDDAVTTQRNTTIAVNVMANDQPKGSLTRPLRIIRFPIHGSTISPINQVIYTPDPNYCGSDFFDYEICNAFGCDTGRVFVTVICTDTTTALKPDAINDVATTKKNQLVTISVLNNDILNGILTGPIRIIKTPNRGSATVTNNQINYTPQSNFCGGNDTLRYEICNVTGCDTAQVVVTITCDTVLPTRLVAVDDRLTTPKNTTIRFRPIDNDTLTATLLAVGVVAAPRHGSIAFSGTDSLIYTPNVNYCGLDTMEYRMCNTTFMCDTATIFITVTCNTPLLRPDAIDDVATTKKNQSVTIGVLNNDVMNGTLTSPVRIIGTLKRGRATVTNNQIIYTPNLNLCSVNDTLTYEICNITGCDTAKVVVTIDCANLPDLRPIVAVNDNITTAKNTSHTFRPTLNDTIRTRLMALSIVTMPRHGSISFTGLDTLVYIPNRDYCGKDTFEYNICDTAFVCDKATVFVTVTCDSLPLLRPVAVNDFDSVLVNRLINLNVLRNDTLNGSLTGPLSIITQPLFGTALVNADGTITYKPFAGFCGANDVFSYRICNATGCSTATVTIKVICDLTVLNKLPVAEPDVVTTTKNTPIRIVILANDTLNGRLDSIKIISSPLLGSAILGNDFVITYTPDSCGFTDSLIYRICNQNGCDTALVTIKVPCDQVIRKPITNDDVVKVIKNRSLLINVLGNDSLFSASLNSIIIFRNPTRGVALIEGNQIRYLPQTDSCAYRDTFSYIICTIDGCDTADVFVNVFCSEDSILKPVAVFDRGRTKTGQPITINVTLNDTLRGANIFRIMRIAQNGVAVFDSLQRIIYTPSRSFCGNDTLIYEICNTNGCDTALVTITVDCLPPVALDDSAKTLYNQNLTIPIVLNDTLNAADSITIIKVPTKGSVTILINKTATYTPNFSFCGKDSFQYVLCNRFGCDSAWVRINVSCGDSLLIFNAISPNQDGKNDGFYLRGIENYPDNEVVIFNRWGNEVYRKKGYRNDEAWQGTWNDKALPDGTYFYNIYLNDKTGKKYIGYLQIMK